ncbi:MAG: hypothetical protein LBL96_01230 [Clostridiales bacterium]|jgi:hypothetical protein|nr:hypothetical protein [Clostridiales bacterium]
MARAGILSNTVNLQLTAGQVYQYQLNARDSAGNTTQLKLTDEVAASYIPTITLFTSLAYVSILQVTFILSVTRPFGWI